MAKSLRELELELLNVEHHQGVTDFRTYPASYRTGLQNTRIRLIEEIEEAKQVESKRS